MIIIILLNALLGLSFTLGKMLLAHGSPCFIVAVRMVMGGLCLSACYRWKHGPLLFETYRDVRLCLQYALMGILGFSLFRAWGLRMIPSSRAALLFALMPVSTAGAAFIVGGERMSSIKVLALIIGLLGIIPLVVPDLSLALLTSFGVAECSLLLAIFLLSGGMVTLQHLVRDRGCNALLINGVGMTFAGFIAFIAAYLFEPVWIHGSCTVCIAMLIVQTVLSNIVCSTLQSHLLCHYSAITLSLGTFIAPLSSIVYGVVLLQEKVTVSLCLSLAVIGISLLFFYIDALQAESKRTVSGNSRGTS